MLPDSNARGHQNCGTQPTGPRAVYLPGRDGCRDPEMTSSQACSVTPVDPMKIIKNSASLVTCAVQYWRSNNASTVGAALAFYCAFSLAPLLVIISTVAGWVIGSAAAYGQVGYQMDALFGPATAKILLGAVQSSQQTHGIIAAWVSVGTLVVSATSVLAALEAALENIWDSTELAPSGVWGWIRRRLLSMGFILALGFLLLVSLTVTTCLATLPQHLAINPAAFVGTIARL